MDAMNEADIIRTVAETGPSISGLAYCIGSIRLKPLSRLTEAEFLDDFRLNALGAAGDRIKPLRVARCQMHRFSTRGQPPGEGCADAAGTAENKRRHADAPSVFTKAICRTSMVRARKPASQ